MANVPALKTIRKGDVIQIIDEGKLTGEMAVVTQVTRWKLRVLFPIHKSEFINKGQAVLMKETKKGKLVVA